LFFDKLPIFFYRKKPKTKGRKGKLNK